MLTESSLRTERSNLRDCFVALLLAMTVMMPPAYAVVGQAERYDEFKETELKEFQQDLVDTERKEQLAQADTLSQSVKAKEGELLKVQGPEKEILDQEIENLKRELLRLPKRDRLRFEMNGRYTYDSNINRRPLRQEKGDSIFDVDSTVLTDLSGRKTDLRLEFMGGKQWNIHFPEKDYWTAEERVRYRKKYFKKILHSLHSRVARTSEKTVEVNEKKVRWDSFQTNTVNYPVTRKLSVNMDVSANKRLFTTEPFDQDSYWEVVLAPSAFWNFTPKSRVSAGYSFGANRIRSKSSDTNAHEVHAGYFGRLTNKSSVSADIAFSHQTPRSLEAPEVNTVTAGMGYIWQMRPKTQATIQFIRSQQNTTSNLVSGTQNETTKTDSHFVNDSLTLSLNHRLTSRLVAVLTFNGSHVRNKVGQGGDEDIETRQFMFPVSVALTYFATRWIRMNLAYTFTYRHADEKPDKFRAHNLQAGVHIMV